MRRPPAVATWFLTRLVANQALIGDLREESCNGRSAAWYWRQVLVAIATDAHREIRAHKLRALRAVIVGWSVLWVYLTCREILRVQLEVGGLTGLNWWRHHGYRIPDWLTYLHGFAGPVVSGWAAGRFQTPPLVFAYAASMLLYLLGWSCYVILYYPSVLPEYSLRTLVIVSGIMLGGVLNAASHCRKRVQA